MKELYLWEIEYRVSAQFVSDREMKIITKNDSYGEAERVFLSVIQESLKDSKFKLDFISNIKPSVKVYAEEVQK